ARGTRWTGRASGCQHLADRRGAAPECLLAGHDSRSRSAGAPPVTGCSRRRQRSDPPHRRTDVLLRRWLLEKRKRGGRADVEVLLGKRDLNSVLQEGSSNGVVQRAGDGLLVARVADPDQELEIERRRPESIEPYLWRRLIENVRVPVCNVQEHAAHMVYVRAVRHADRGVQAHPGIAVGPVHDPPRHELRVRDDDRDVVPRDDLRRTYADDTDLPVGVPDGHVVAHRDRPLDQQDDPGNEVARQVLEAEAYPDAQDARHDRDAREIHLQGLETEKHAQGQYGVVRKTEGGELDSRIEMQAREHPTLE